MTYLERMANERDKFVRLRANAIRRGDLITANKFSEKIAAHDKEVAESAKRQPLRLNTVLKSQGEDVKNEIYRSLLKISLAADFLNDCIDEAKDAMAKVDLKDFTLRAEAQELYDKSMKLASFAIIPGNNVLEDMIVDNDDFRNTCDDAANRHLKDKLNL